jgi:cytosine/adenosine deaminase-related metal-dependent hydrolase
MVRYRASWILPISSPPIRDGWVVLDRGRIVALGPSRSASNDGRDVPDGVIEDVDLGDSIVLPGLVNAHTHLELSYLRDEVAPSSEFVAWVRTLMAERRQHPDPRAPHIVSAIQEAVRECLASGTAVVGDISNTLVPFASLVDSPLAAVLFYELIRFNTPDAAAVVEQACKEIEALGPAPRIRVSLAAHAPYSVAPLVFRAIRRVVDREPFAPCSVHLAESVEEVEFIRTAGGPWRQVLEDVGAWDPAWVAPGCSPVEFLDNSGFLDARVLAVHGVQMTLADLARLAARGTTLVTCPRSNGHTGAGAPPIEDFYASGVAVAVGTDSLASAPDLSIFAEIATMRALAPTVPASRLLASATYHGARALGFDADYGTIDPGKAGRLLAVDVPGGTNDVEEYLVSGILNEQLTWLES